MIVTRGSASSTVQNMARQQCAWRMRLPRRQGSKLSVAHPPGTEHVGENPGSRLLAVSTCDELANRVEQCLCSVLEERCACFLTASASLCLHSRRSICATCKAFPEKSRVMIRGDQLHETHSLTRSVSLSLCLSLSLSFSLSPSPGLSCFPSGPDLLRHRPWYTGKCEAQACPAGSSGD